MLDKYFLKTLSLSFFFVVEHFPVYIFLACLKRRLWGGDSHCCQFQLMSALACSSYWHHHRLASLSVPFTCPACSLHRLRDSGFSHSIKPLLPLMQNPLLYTPASMQPCSRTNCRVLFETELIQNDFHCDSSNERPETKPCILAEKWGQALTSLWALHQLSKGDFVSLVSSQVLCQQWIIVETVLLC